MFHLVSGPGCEVSMGRRLRPVALRPQYGSELLRLVLSGGRNPALDPDRLRIELLIPGSQSLSFPSLFIARAKHIQSISGLA